MTVGELESSLADVGLINPLIVRPTQADPEHEWTLVTGLQRLRAAQNAGLTTVLARVLILDDLKARLLQIDEDLVRKVLSAAEKAALIAERRDVYNKTHNDRARAAHATNKKLGRRNASDTLSPAFTEGLAASTGVSRKSIERSAAQGAAIGKDRLKGLVRTSLDKPTELEALTKIPSPDRENLIQRAIAGEEVSAKALLKGAKKAPKNGSTFERLQTAWDGASEEDRQKFLARNGLIRKTT